MTKSAVSKMIPGNEEMKKSFIQKIFSSRKMEKSAFDSLDSQLDSGTERPLFGGLESAMSSDGSANSYRIFVATWNVGGKSPHSGLNLDDFLQIQEQYDIYVLGFQETVPLNAGNVLVLEDNGPAAKWLSLISQSLNKSFNTTTTHNNIRTISAFDSFKPNAALKAASNFFRTESSRKLKSCNCTAELERLKYGKDSCFGCQQSNISENGFSSDEEEDDPISSVLRVPEIANQMKYSLIVSKQMVGIFVTIWVRTELVQHIGHLRTSCVSRGIMGCLRNKGCISVSMTIHQTSICFVCSHLASGEKEGDELRRNSDVIEILKNTQFPKICRTPNSRMPERILEHDRVIWFGDLNYRIALSYSETQKHLQKNDWNVLLDKDQLKIEREAGRVFKGWKEGKIYFAPTYKYSYNSDMYASETIKSKSKRRTPAWCDRILWHGNGVRQLSYTRKESRFSDHRPVCASFLVNFRVVEP